MIKIIKEQNNYLKSVVEHESEMFWNFNERNLKMMITNHQVANNLNLAKLYLFINFMQGQDKEIYDKELMPLFGVFQSFIKSICKIEMK